MVQHDKLSFPLVSRVETGLYADAVYKKYGTRYGILYDNMRTLFKTIK